MSVPHSPAELQKLYQRRFAGVREYRDLVWRRVARDLGPSLMIRWTSYSPAISSNICTRSATFAIP
jgi:hypothetical protein